MRYFGSKASAVGEILGLVAASRPHGIFCDPFGGVGTVGAHFKANGYEVCTGDHLRFAYYFQVARIELSGMPAFAALKAELDISDTQGIKSYLNTLPPRMGWLVKYYALRRRFFTISNAMMAEAVRASIVEWKLRRLISDSEYALLIASFIGSLDRVANTAGTYYAFLKRWYRKALRPFTFEWLAPTRGGRECHAHLGDASATARAHTADILYLDPPHNTRRYDDYYHLPESIALGYTGSVRGKAGLPNRARTPSEFSVRASALDALARLIERSAWRTLVLHYSDSGLMTPAQLRDFLTTYGVPEEHEVEVKGYSTTGNATAKHRIYLVRHG